MQVTVPAQLSVSLLLLPAKQLRRPEEFAWQRCKFTLASATLILYMLASLLIALLHSIG